MNTQFIRPQAAELVRRLREPRRFIQSISGARQVGKTTLACMFITRDLATVNAIADESIVMPLSSAPEMGPDWTDKALVQHRAKSGMKMAGN